MRYDIGDRVSAYGCMGSVGIYPPSRDIPEWEAPTDTSVWFVPDGWPSFMGRWAEEDELATNPDATGDAR